MKQSAKLALGIVAIAALGFSSLTSAQDGGDQNFIPDPEARAQIQEIHEAFKSGDTERAKELKEQYGIEGRQFGRAHKKMGKKLGKFGHNLDPEQKEAVKTAIENNDYAAFLEAIGDEAAEKATEERFAKMVTKHQQHQAVKTAMENGDYEAFIAALGDKAPEDLTEEKFNQMQEVRAAKEAGDIERAKELIEEYDLKGMMKKRGKCHKDHGKQEGFQDQR